MGTWIVQVSLTLYSFDFRIGVCSRCLWTACVSTTLILETCLMPKSDQLTGSCVCGAVCFSVLDDFISFKFCHCSLCRKLSGSAHVANLFGSPAHINWLAGREHIVQYDVPNSQVRRVFCSQCGTGLPFVTQDGAILVTPAGVLNASPSIAPQYVASWESRADWYESGLDLTTTLVVQAHHY